MPTTIEKIWSELLQEKQSEHSIGGAFRIRLIDESRVIRIYAGINQKDEVMLAIGVNGRPPEFSLTSRSLEYFRQPRKDGTWLMVLRLPENKLQPVFGRLCQDLIDETAPDASDAEFVVLFRERMDLWQRLFEVASAAPLDKHKVKGLIAELITLKGLLRDGESADIDIVTGWRGPERAEQDFQFIDRAIEVKSVSPGAKEIAISSLGQLCTAVPMELHVLMMIEASPDDRESVNLPILVAAIESRLSSNTACLAAFRRKVRESGYFEEPRFEEICFILKGVSRYGISDAFPRLTLADVPNGITRATYALQLQAIERFAVMRTTLDD
jgi:hypothetical protein